MNISLAAKHNLMNVVIIILPTLLAYTVYYLGGGNFERDRDLGFASFIGFTFSALAAGYVASDRSGWR